MRRMSPVKTGGSKFTIAFWIVWFPCSLQLWIDPTLTGDNQIRSYQSMAWVNAAATAYRNIICGSVSHTEWWQWSNFVRLDGFYLPLLTMTNSALLSFKPIGQPKHTVA